MKNRKTRLIIGMLVGLVFFSSSVALLMYMRQGVTKEVTSIEVYVTSRDISEGTLISVDDIKKASLPKSYISFTPLVASEIVGHYAKVSMFTDEPFRKEKLSMVKPDKKATSVLLEKKVKVEKKVQEPETLSQYDNNKDTILLPLTLFKNVDDSLKAGDYIDIVTVIPKKNSKDGSFSTKYVAVHLSINSFVSNSHRVKRLVNVDETGLTTKANSVVFDILPGDVKNILATYYKTQELNTQNIYNTKRNNNGHLWMVKCTTDMDDNIQKYKKKMLVDHVTVYKKRKKKKTAPKVSISYED